MRPARTGVETSLDAAGKGACCQDNAGGYLADSLTKSPIYFNGCPEVFSYRVRINLYSI